MHTIKLKIAKTALKDGRTPGNITLPDIKLHYRDTVIKYKRVIKILSWHFMQAGKQRIKFKT